MKNTRPVEETYLELINGTIQASSLESTSVIDISFDKSVFCETRLMVANGDGDRLLYGVTRSLTISIPTAKPINVLNSPRRFPDLIMTNMMGIISSVSGDLTGSYNLMKNKSYVAVINANCICPFETQFCDQILEIGDDYPVFTLKTTYTEELFTHGIHVAEIVPGRLQR